MVMVHLEHFKDFCWDLIDSKLQLLIDQVKGCVVACYLKVTMIHIILRGSSFTPIIFIVLLLPSIIQESVDPFSAVFFLLF